jgi:hypothetical protein
MKTIYDQLYERAVLLINLSHDSVLQKHLLINIKRNRQRLRYIYFTEKMGP